MIDTVHAFDPDVIFQGCLFESVTKDVNNLKIPAWVFTDLGLPVENRTFSCDSMIKRKGSVSTRMGEVASRLSIIVKHNSGFLPGCYIYQYWL